MTVPIFFNAKKRVVCDLFFLEDVSFLRVSGDIATIEVPLLFHPFIRQGLYFYVSSALLKTVLHRIQQAFEGVSRLHFVVLQLSGVGYKVYTPRSLAYRSLVFKLGFGASALFYSVPALIKMRARKQKLLMVSPCLILLRSIVANIIGLRYPVVYTGKGIFNRAFFKKGGLKKRKQQMRGK